MGGTNNGGLQIKRETFYHRALPYKLGFHSCTLKLACFCDRDMFELGAEVKDWQITAALFIRRTHAVENARKSAPRDLYRVVKGNSAQCHNKAILEF